MPCWTRSKRLLSSAKPQRPNHVRAGSSRSTYPGTQERREMAVFLIYGANGYTGALIARASVARGHRPVLAGRNADALEALARELNLQHRVFALDDPAAVRNGIRNAGLVLNCAGPFA